jgi:hypothetical protein
LIFIRKRLALQVFKWAQVVVLDPSFSFDPGVFWTIVGDISSRRERNTNQNDESVIIATSHRPDTQENLARY